MHLMIEEKTETQGGCDIICTRSLGEVESKTWSAALSIFFLHFMAISSISEYYQGLGECF